MGKSVLVVDDDAMNLKMAEMFLKKAGFEIIKAVSGAECLEILGKEQVELVLLDVEMPEMNGIETLEKIKEQEKLSAVPVMFLSASEEMDEAVAAHKYAVAGMIKKPFLPSKMIEAVKNVIG